MSVEMAILVAFSMLFVLILMEVPLGFCLGIAGAVGILFLRGPEVVVRTLASVPFQAVASYSLFAVPMFILLGSLIAHANIAEKIYSSANMMVGRLPGGLAAATAAATAIFSGISGSSAADVATMGRVSVGEMRRHGYSPQYSAAVVAAAGAFAALIPPSIVLVLYGILAEESVGAMLVAGIVPGGLSAAVLVAYVVSRAAISRNPSFGGGDRDGRDGHVGSDSTSPAPLQVSAPVLASEIAETTTSRLSQLSVGLGYSALLFVVVAGGIYTGIFTATEAGAVGAFTALVLGLSTTIGRWKRAGGMLVTSFAEASRITSMIFLLLVGGSIFGFFIASSRIPIRITEWINGLPVSPGFVLVLFLIVLLTLGTILDGLSILLLTVPIIAPIVDGLGYDGVWFGILVLKMIEIGLITPPVGINCYIMAGLIPGLPVEKVFRAVAPFVLLDLGVTAVLFTFPGLVTWLPELAGL